MTPRGLALASALASALAWAAGCARPAPPLEPTALPAPPPGAGRLRLGAVIDERPRGERDRYPAASFEGALRASLGGRLDDGAAASLRVRLLRLGAPGEGAEALVELSIEAGGASLLRARRGAVVGATWRSLQGAVGQITRGLAADIDRAMALRHPALPGAATRAAFSVFLVERVALTRDIIETLYIEASTARVLRHDLAPLADDAHAAPGEWLLSRRTVEGLTLSGEAYEALVEALSGGYDLRPAGDAHRRHFFGVKGARVR